MTLEQEALKFIWEGQSGMIEMRKTFYYPTYLSVTSALKEIEKGFCYFSPLKRASKGMFKENVAPTGNVLWIDLDSRSAPEILEKHIQPYGLVPSVLVDSANKGYWGYYKLDQMIPVEEIESLNRGLTYLLRGQGVEDADYSWYCSKIARLPGSINQKSGKQAHVAEMSGAVYSLADVAFLKEFDPKLNQPDEFPVNQEDEIETEGLWNVMLRLSKWRGIDRYLNTMHSLNKNVDRSKWEAKIYYSLCMMGYTTMQICDFADSYWLPHHVWKVRQTGTLKDTVTRIKEMRGYANFNKETGSLLSNQESSLLLRKSDTYRWNDRSDALRLIQDGMTTSEFVSQLDAGRATGFRILKQLERAGHVTRERIGRSVILHPNPQSLTPIAGRYTRPLNLPTISQTRKSDGIS